jgi:Flp pilus assembly protein TadG
MLMQISRNRPSSPTRRGSIVVLAAVFSVVILAFAAFTVDVGFIAIVKQQMQAAGDGASLAAATELMEPLRLGAAPTSQVTIDALNSGRTAAETVAAANRSGYSASTSIDPIADVEFGNRSWNSAANEWVTNWNVGPFNSARVTIRKDSARGNPLPLAFAPAISHQSIDLQEVAVASLIPGVGIRVNPSGTAPILPFAVDLDSWFAFSSATGPDNWSYNASTGAVTPGSDGIPEFAIFPNQPDTSFAVWKPRNREHREPKQQHGRSSTSNQVRR